jgi:hypothetical protein
MTNYIWISDFIEHQFRRHTHRYKKHYIEINPPSKLDFGSSTWLARRRRRCITGPGGADAPDLVGRPSSRHPSGAPGRIRVQPFHTCHPARGPGLGANGTAAEDVRSSQMMVPAVEDGRCDEGMGERKRWRGGGAETLLWWRCTSGNWPVVSQEQPAVGSPADEQCKRKRGEWEIVMDWRTGPGLKRSIPTLPNESLWLKY